MKASLQHTLIWGKVDKHVDILFLMFKSTTYTLKVYCQHWAGDINLDIICQALKHINPYLTLYCHFSSVQGSKRCHSAQTLQPVYRQQEKGWGIVCLCPHGSADCAISETYSWSLPSAQSQESGERLVCVCVFVFVQCVLGSNGFSLSGPSPVKGDHLKLTQPHTPHLKTLQRSRPPTVKSSADLEAEEVERLHK